MSAPAAPTVLERIAGLPAYPKLVVALMTATFALRAWSVGRWSWNSDDWIYLHDASTTSLIPYVLQNYNGHFMPGEFLIVWVLNALWPLDHGVIVLVTAAWAAALVGLWAIALRDLWGSGWVTWAALVLLALSPLMVHSTMWWAAALQTLSLQTCFAACLYFVARLLRSGGERGLLGLVVSYAVGLVMWEKALFLVLPIAVILVHAAPEPLAAAVRRYRRAFAWLAGLSAVYLAVFLVAGRLSGPPSANAVHLGVAQSLGDSAGFYYDLWAHLLAPGLLGGPWGTLPTPEEVDSRPALVVSLIALAALAVLAGWLLRRGRRSWLPLAAAVLYAAVAWGTILYSSRFEVVSWHRLGYERYAVDIFVVLVVLLGAAVAGVRRPSGGDESPGRPGLRRGAAVAVVLALTISLSAASVATVLRFGVSPTKAWLANIERGVDELGSAALVDRYAPEDVMPVLFWADQARLSYLLAPWGDRVRFQGPAPELRVADDEGRISPTSFSAVVSAPLGPVADCGYAVEPGAAQVVDLEPDVFAYEWVLKIDAFSSSAGTLLVRGEQELEIPISSGLGSQQVVIVGAVDELELEMAPGSALTCVTGVEVGSVEPTD